MGSQRVGHDWATFTFMPSLQSGFKIMTHVKNWHHTEPYLFSRTVATAPAAKAVFHQLAQSTEGSVHDGLASSATCRETQPSGEQQWAAWVSISDASKRLEQTCLSASSSVQTDLTTRVSLRQDQFLLGCISCLKFTLGKLIPLLQF